MTFDWYSALQAQAMRLRPGPAAFAALAVLAFGIALLLEARQRAATEARNALDIAAEDDASCARLGAPPGTVRFASCAAELRAIRRRHAERLAGAPGWF